MRPFRRTKHTVSVDVRALEALLRELEPSWPFLLLEILAIAEEWCDEKTLAASGMTLADVVEAERAAMALASFVCDEYAPSFPGPRVSLDASIGMLTRRPARSPSADAPRAARRRSRDRPRRSPPVRRLTD